MKRMISMAISTLMIIVLFVTTTVSAFANNSQRIYETNDSYESMTTDKAITNIKNLEFVNSTKENHFSLRGEYLKVAADDQKILFQSNDIKTITMDFPEKTSLEKSDRNEIDYISPNGNIKYSFEAIQEKQNGITIETLNSKIFVLKFAKQKKQNIMFTLPNEYELVRAEDYYIKDIIDEGWYYIVNNESEVTKQEIMVAISPMKAFDAEGKEVSIVSNVEKNKISFEIPNETGIKYPITIEQTVSTKPDNELIDGGNGLVVIDNSEISSLVTLAGFGKNIMEAGFKKAFKEYAEKELTKQIEKQLTKKGVILVSKFIMRIMVVIDLYCAWQYLTDGYSYTNISYWWQLWKIYKHQGGRWAQGYQEKGGINSYWGS